jgi:hypothetical protein
MAYSITSSTRDSGIVSPSALAVFLLITRSNFVGCSTGSSAGLAPCNSPFYPQKRTCGYFGGSHCRRCQPVKAGAVSPRIWVRLRLRI